jgi:hypothetical protein
MQPARTRQSGHQAAHWRGRGGPYFIDAVDEPNLTLRPLGISRSRSLSSLIKASYLLICRGGQLEYLSRLNFCVPPVGINLT